MTATDTRPADLAALRTSLRVEVERVCHGAEWRERDSELYEDLHRADGAWAAARDREFGTVFLYGDTRDTDPTSDIGAAMALVDQLQAEGWPEAALEDFGLALSVAASAIHPDASDMTMVAQACTWALVDCPSALRPLVLTLAVLAARGSEWRRYLPLLTEET